MAAPSASRSWSRLGRRALAASAVAATALVAFAVPASAHIPKADAECDGEKTVLWVDLTKYVKDAENTVKVVEVTDDGEKVLEDTTFEESFKQTWDDFDPTVPHKFKVTVVAGDGPNNPAWSKTFELKVKACKKEEPSEPPSSEPPPSSEEPPPSSEAPTTTPTTEAPVGANANLADTGVSIAVPAAIGGLLLVGGATMLLVLRRRRKA